MLVFCNYLAAHIMMWKLTFAPFFLSLEFRMLVLNLRLDDCFPWCVLHRGFGWGTPTLLYFFRLFNRANLQALVAPDALILLDKGVLKPLFIFFHTYCGFRTNRITRRAATAVFFSFVKNWYIFHCVFPFYYLLFNHPAVWMESRKENGMDGF